MWCLYLNMKLKQVVISHDIIHELWNWNVHKWFHIIFTVVLTTPPLTVNVDKKTTDGIIIQLPEDTTTEAPTSSVVSTINPTISSIELRTSYLSTDIRSTSLTISSSFISPSQSTPGVIPTKTTGSPQYSTTSDSIQIIIPITQSFVNVGPVRTPFLENPTNGLAVSFPQKSITLDSTLLVTICTKLTCDYHGVLDSIT